MLPQRYLDRPLMIDAQDVIAIYHSLSAHNIRAWLTGGWGIDALLHRQTRPHKDLDVIILVDDVVRLRDLLGRAGYRLKDLWSENTWVLDSSGTEIPTAFVLHDSQGRELDVHAMHLDGRGDGIPAWVNDEGLVFREKDLAAQGLIAGQPVPCISPEMQLLAHTGYDLPPQHLRDLELLHEKLGVALPVSAAPSPRTESPR